MGRCTDSRVKRRWAGRDRLPRGRPSRSRNSADSREHTPGSVSHNFPFPTTSRIAATTPYRLVIEQSETNRVEPLGLCELRIATRMTRRTQPPTRITIATAPGMTSASTGRPSAPRPNHLQSCGARSLRPLFGCGAQKRMNRRGFGHAVMARGAAAE